MIINDAAGYIRTFKTTFTGDYKELFEKEVTRLIEIHLDDIRQRIEAVAFLVESYILDTGDRPDAEQLDRLASHLLYEDLEGDTHPDKVTNTEYPIFTQAQLSRREKSRGEYPVDINKLVARGSDGKDYTPTSMRKRRKGELMAMERESFKRNRARKAQYKKDTSPGSVITYFITDQNEMRPSFQSCQDILDKYKNMISTLAGGA